MPLNKGFYIANQWQIEGLSDGTFPLINPATEKQIGEVPLANKQAVEEAITAANDAFQSFSQTPSDERIALVERIRKGYEKRLDDIAHAISTEMGAPITLAKKAQARLGLAQIDGALEAAKNFDFVQANEGFDLRYDAAGVCALITPWNWPMNQALCKIAPALLSGCTMVFKPSELAPLSAQILGEIIAEAAPPAGVFNMLFGLGESIGPMLSADPRIDVVSLTGSQRAGTSVLTEAAMTIKRVALELGGKSPNILLPNCSDWEKVTRSSVRSVMNNSGQSCNAPTRLFVPRENLEQIEQLIIQHCQEYRVGDPTDVQTTMGPIANQRQYDRVKYYIQTGQDEGAQLLTGGAELPDHLTQGFYVKPTVFSHVNNQMRIAQEEIFGPVLCIIPYDSVDEAISMANDTQFGLSAHVYSDNQQQAKEVAAKIRAGNVHINNASAQFAAPFGGFKQSGIGREWGLHGLLEFLEVKSVFKRQ